jgi:hypothetical protein
MAFKLSICTSDSITLNFVPVMTCTYLSTKSRNWIWLKPRSTSLDLYSSSHEIYEKRLVSFIPFLVALFRTTRIRYITPEFFSYEISLLVSNLCVMMTPCSMPHGSTSIVSCSILSIFKDILVIWCCIGFSSYLLFPSLRLIISIASISSSESHNFMLFIIFSLLAWRYSAYNFQSIFHQSSINLMIWE